MIIDIIREQIQKWDHVAKWKLIDINLDTLIVSKDIERQMYLDNSFSKGENFVNTIKVDSHTLDFVVVDGKGIIKVLVELNKK